MLSNAVLRAMYRPIHRHSKNRRVIPPSKQPMSFSFRSGALLSAQASSNKVTNRWHELGPKVAEISSFENSCNVSSTFYIRV
jgi:hypothetical protein